MKSRSASKIKLTSYDELLSGEEVTVTITKNIVQVPIEQLHSFKNHPFHVNDDEAMDELVESVKQEGILTALLVRPMKKGGYEIIAGHRRKHAAQLAGLNQVPVIIREMDQDTAVRAMVDTNLQRPYILPSEKAFAYGKKRLCLMMFGGMMFLISSCLNNITAVMMILPIVFVLLKTLEVDRKYVSVFFAVILALSNTGGAASPVGDFPAIVIMTSGITSFLSYLTHAFPLFAVTSTVLVVVWGLQVKNDVDDGAVRKLAISNLKSQYKNINIRFDVLKLLAVVFIGMFLAWSFVPQNILPPEVIAVLGYVVAMVICSTKGVKVEQTTDLKSVLTIASFLFFAQVISQTGVLNLIAAYLQSNIHNPKLLVMAIMVITSVVAGVFSAGPAATAMMPIIIQVCNGPLNAYSDWIAVAYAAAICAGSSLFMWSATAGFILSGKVNDASIQEENGKSISWGVGQYMKFGFVNYAIQISIALIAMAIIL